MCCRPRRRRHPLTKRKTLPLLSCSTENISIALSMSCIAEGTQYTPTDTNQPVFLANTIQFVPNGAKSLGVLRAVHNEHFPPRISRFSRFFRSHGTTFPGNHQKAAPSLGFLVPGKGCCRSGRGTPQARAAPSSIQTRVHTIATVYPSPWLMAGSAVSSRGCPTQARGARDADAPTNSSSVAAPSAPCWPV